MSNSIAILFCLCAFLVLFAVLAGCLYHLNLNRNTDKDQK